MKRFILIFVGLLFLNTDAMAVFSNSFVGEFGAIMIDTSSELALKMYTTFQASVTPLLGILMFLYLIFYAISLLKQESFSLKEVFQNIAKRGIMMGMAYGLLAAPPSFYFEITIVPIIDIGLYYGQLILQASDSTYVKCMEIATYIPAEGIFSPALQQRFVCILEIFFSNILIGIYMAVMLIIAPIVAIGVTFFIPEIGPLISIGIFILYLPKLALGTTLIKMFSDIALDLIWRFIDTLFQFVVGAMMIPFAILGWVFKGEESKFFPDLSGFISKTKELFLTGTIYLIFWCINLGLIHYLLLITLSKISFFFAEQEAYKTITELGVNKLSIGHLLTDSFMAQLPGTFFFNLESWLLLLSIAILSKYIIKKSDFFAKELGIGVGEEFIYSDLKKSGEQAGKYLKDSAKKTGETVKSIIKAIKG